jgi:hypothetical protein
MAAHQYQSTLDIIINCAFECEQTADQCISILPESARLSRDCAQICWVAASYIKRDSRFIPQISTACIDICDACACECEKHPEEFCQNCADACRNAVEEFRWITGIVAGV